MSFAMCSRKVSALCERIMWAPSHYVSALREVLCSQHEEISKILSSFTLRERIM
jgi:hypothetical protein